MEDVCKELDEAKAEIERLREQYRVKVEVADSLKIAHIDQISKAKDASSKLDRLARELSEKEEEIFTVKQRNEELGSRLIEKESILKNLTYLHDKLRVDLKGDVQKREHENEMLGLALDDANAKNMDQERQICSLKEQIERVKSVLDGSQKKCSELAERVKECEQENKLLGLALDDANSKNMDQERQVCLLKEEIKGIRSILACSQKCSPLGDKVKDFKDELFELEERNRKFEDQLKWKKEQFGHLEEAHQKLRNEFRMREKEWEKDKAALLGNISSLQLNLDSEIRISKDFQNRLEMCNQALAHAESKRKIFEIQLLESRTSFDNVCCEYKEAKSELEHLTNQTAQEIANMRSTLRTKEVLYKEMEYQLKKVEQEKQELMVCLKEIREDQIREAGRFSSSSKLRNKQRSLEQVHKECSENLKAKESEWLIKTEKLTAQLMLCKSELKDKDVALNEVKMELEACDSLILNLELMNQETSLMLLVLRSEFLEARLRLADIQASADHRNNCIEDNICGLVEKLEAKEAAFKLVCSKLEEEREKVAFFSERVQILEGLQVPLQNELNKLEKTLKESSICQINSEEKVLQLQGDLAEIRDALDRTNEELNDKLFEANKLEFEMKIWRSIAEQLEANHKENYKLRREMEASLLAHTEVEVNLKQEKESNLLAEKDKEIDHLQKRLAESTKVEEIVDSFQNAEIYQKERHDVEQEWVKNEFEGAVLAQVDAEKTHEHEKQTLHQLVEEREERIYNLQQLVASLEHEFESSTASFSSMLSHMQEEMNIFHESWEKIKTADVLKEMEIQEKDLMIMELENDLIDIEKKIQESQLAAASSENKDLVDKMGCFLDRIKNQTSEDNHLMENLRKMVQSMDIEDPERRLNGDDEEDDSKENININCFSSSFSMKKAEGVERSPLRAFNN
ncbi:uncharacterized protein At4g38062 isoform X2 [Primulina eburnea]|uniref:uncharacterized protein At4g38062 isoform X2 n=1 Tax=Primulina eburnea TaxID=1245227 RepID=UPI003C6BEEDB